MYEKPTGHALHRSWAFFLTLALSASGCNPQKADSRRAVSAVEHPSPNANPRYAPGRWRLAPFSEVDRTVLWLSHIVVLHRDSKPEFSRLRPPPWAPESLPDRSREDAKRLALEIRRRVTPDVRRFAAIATQYSEDVVSRDSGGSLGGVMAGQLPPSFLDAWIALAPGQISEVLESPMGFHILLRRAPPPPEALNALRIVIRYRNTMGEGSSTRMRDAARDLAQTVVTQARSGVSFTSLVEKYSESPERIRQGAMGIWQTSSPGDHSRVVEKLAELPIGNVSDPIETRFGFEIVKRIELKEDVKLAMRAVRLEYDPGVPRDGAGSEQRVFERARELARRAHASPSAFGATLREYCCKDVVRWHVGHADPVLTSAVEHLRVGEIAADPVRVATAFVIPQRLDPELLPEGPAVAYELPQPGQLDMAELVRLNETKSVLSQLQELRRAKLAADFADEEKRVIGTAFEQFEQELSGASTAEARVTAYRNTLRRLYTGLPAATYAHLLQTMQTWLANQMFGVAL